MTNQQRSNQSKAVKKIPLDAKTIRVMASGRSPTEKNPDQHELDLCIERNAESDGIGMGVLSDGTAYLSQRGLARLCGVENAHIGTMSRDWTDENEKPRIRSIKDILRKSGYEADQTHLEINHKNIIHHCFPCEICLAVLEYYAFDAEQNRQEEALFNFRRLAGSQLRDLIYAQVGYSPSNSNGPDKFSKWLERVELNHKSAPIGCFSVFNEAHTIVFEMIEAGIIVDEKTVVDISIGSHWGYYWDENSLGSVYGDRTRWPHRFPLDHPQAKSNPQEAWCYPNAALGEFRDWLQATYLEGGKFRDYLLRKVSRGDISRTSATLALEKIVPPQIEVKH